MNAKSKHWGRYFIGGGHFLMRLKRGGMGLKLRGGGI